jgi:putative tricarboxylic transport membrane protein
METLGYLADGFGVALGFTNILYCLLGVLLGTLIGVLPGIGPIATIAMLLPATYYLPPETALIMLAGIYYGAQYGGSTTAILINLPGEISSVVTCLDGHRLARAGNAGKALGIAALSSFLAGTLATLLIAAFAPPLADVAIEFGPADYFCLMVLGLIAAVVLAQGSLVRALAMVILGLLLGLVGTDIYSGEARFTFGEAQLADGLGIGAVAMGVFGVADVIRNLEGDTRRDVLTRRVRGVLPSWQDVRTAISPALRGTTLGSLLGILPGGGPVIASFSSYALEKRISSNPSKFGEGALEGVAAPEAANNAAAQTSFIPLLTLGIPSNAVMALMIGAMIIHGIQPGPGIMSERPELFWGMIASMWLGNLLLLLLNLPLIGIWIRLLAVQYRFLYPAILLFCCIGVYAVNNSTFDVLLLAAFGLVGYVLVKLGCEPAPLLLGFVLGPMMEENLRRALLLSHGNFSVFVIRPISLALLTVAALLLLVAVAPAVARKRALVMQQ